MQTETALLWLILVLLILKLSIWIVVIARFTQIQNEEIRILQGLATQIAVMDARQLQQQNYPNG